MKGDRRLMRCVTGVVTILPFPVLIYTAGAYPRHYPATAETPVPQRLFPDLQNKTRAVLKEPTFAVIVRRDDDLPVFIKPADRVAWGKKPKIYGVRKKTRRLE